MKPKNLWQISVATLVEAEEAVTALLERVFRQSPALYTDEETLVTTVTVYGTERAIRAPRRHAALVAGLRVIRTEGLPVGPGSISIKKLRQQDWEHSWKRHFKPLEISPALLIKPSWSKRRAKKNQAVVILDPGLSFGTGQHATTSFCLRQIVAIRNLEKTQSLLDIGCGSGILSIAAAKLGYQPVHAFDFDPEAVRLAKANATTNGAPRKIQLRQQDLTRLPSASAVRYDLVCANLIYDLLLAEQKRILARLKPGGVLVLAGILATQFPLVKAAYVRAGMKLAASCHEQEWQSGAFVFQRHSA
jgi:ribosomal protein L11 methyltransferase